MDSRMVDMLRGLFPRFKPADGLSYTYSMSPITLTINGVRLTGIRSASLLSEETLCLYGNGVTACIFWSSIKQINADGVKRY